MQPHAKVLDAQFDVLLIDSFQTAWSGAKIAHETGDKVLLRPS